MAKLTNQEIQVLRRIAIGRSNKMIAANLQVAESTVKNHVSSIFKKLDADDRTHAVTIAIRLGLMSINVG